MALFNDASVVEITRVCAPDHGRRSSIMSHRGIAALESACVRAFDLWCACYKRIDARARSLALFANSRRGG